MTLPIAELEFYPSQIAWMESRLLSCCSNTIVLKAVVDCVDKQDIQAQHFNLVEKTAGIARGTLRPQRAPTFRELQMLQREYKQEPQMREVQHGRLSSMQAEQNTVKAMTSRGTAAPAVRIGRAA
ncbi:hypothetical protein IB270_29410 [Ensifer sp. ENS05]|uniref:hypothetical protein n=1 Tax=Ensifer sp. ENS05 TaxID=2769277 RepID=UPI001786AE6C|nr:hypothetical protein [Ensifer sp. ENS05]MBD9596954.1 hypothetical protein [Ensifer sp. ENS05]